VALPELLQPAGTCFLVADHAFTPDPLHDDMSPMQGHDRKEMVQTYAPRFVDVALILEADEAVVYDGWFENTLIVGNGLFTARIARLGEAVLQYWAAQWVGPPNWQALSKGRWRLSGRLLLTGEGQSEPPNDPALEIEFTVALTGTAALSAGVALEIEYQVALISETPLDIEFLVELLGVEIGSYFEREDSGFIEREDGSDLQRE
jgi:hypothetical protein